MSTFVIGCCIPAQSPVASSSLSGCYGLMGCATLPSRRAPVNNMQAQSTGNNITLLFPTVTPCWRWA